jgi:hypothetical protein
MGVILWVYQRLGGACPRRVAGHDGLREMMALIPRWNKIGQSSHDDLSSRVSPFCES